MAYQVRHRDPIFDADTQAMIEQRGRELLGVVLLLAGMALCLMLGSYTQDDPSWLSVTEEPAQNMLGRFGAALASPLYIIIGWGAWVLAAFCMTWGWRFVRHIGTDRAMSRVVFAPIAVALVAVFASTNVPSASWTHSFGLGGLFGDTVLGAVLGILPVSATFGLKFLSIGSALGSVFMVLFVLGFTLPEMKALVRWIIRRLIEAYAHGVEFGLRTSGRAAQSLQSIRENRAQRMEYAATQLHDDADSYSPMRAEPSVTSPRGLEPIQTAIYRAPVASPTTMMDDLDYDDGAPVPEVDDRVKARIFNAIRQRAESRPDGRAEPPLMRPAPIIAPKSPIARVAVVEPSIEVLPDVAEAFDDDSFMPDEFIAEALPLDPTDDFMEASLAAPVRTYGAPETRAVVQHNSRKPTAPSRKALSEAQPSLGFDDQHSDYACPPLSLLENPVVVKRHVLSDESLTENARMLESVLDDYGVKGEITSVRPGPVVTMYELEPAPGLKASRVIGLSDDIARSMSALSARVSTVPGRTVIGIELPNAHREKVVLREILSARDFGDSQMRLPLALGKDISGDPVVANLAKMPHLLIAGTTGSGKSVAINTMILSLLYKLTPDECRLIMIDPKMLELSVYDGIPHLLSPVVTDPKKAVVALKWVVGEMEDRYRRMSKMGVRNIEGYNGRVQEALAKSEMFRRTVQTGFDDDTGEPIFETEEFQPEKLPYIVVIVDEMADLMMVAGKEIEACIQRLAQMARASGIHLIMATQRPSVDVITGTIKANFPTRISFQVTSKIDSRTILGEQGAEQLLGMGDMLYMAGGSRITRVHGPFVSDEEVEEVVNYLKGFGPPTYVNSVIEGPDDDRENDIDLVLGLGSSDSEDALYDTAVAIVAKDRKCSTSYIQRKLAIGYNKAARLVDQMEENGIVSQANHMGKREILVPER